MPRIPTHYMEANGWTKWIQPVMRGYRMACCDCGLVHDMDFKVVRHGKRNNVQLRARRNERLTAAMRRKKRRTG